MIFIWGVESYGYALNFWIFFHLYFCQKEVTCGVLKKKGKADTPWFGVRKHERLLNRRKGYN